MDEILFFYKTLKYRTQLRVKCIKAKITCYGDKKQI